MQLPLGGHVLKTFMHVYYVMCDVSTRGESLVIFLQRCGATFIENQSMHALDNFSILIRQLEVTNCGNSVGTLPFSHRDPQSFKKMRGSTFSIVRRVLQLGERLTKNRRNGDGSFFVSNAPYPCGLTDLRIYLVQISNAIFGFQLQL